MLPVFYGLEARWCQILGMCDQGSAALGKLFKDAEKDPYAFPWDKMKGIIAQIYAEDPNLQEADLLICTEPLAGCMMMRQIAEEYGRRLPILGYLGVALLNSCPPDDIDTFWSSLAQMMLPAEEGAPSVQLAVNNLILSEQIYYQSGYRMPYVRAHGLYTEMAYTPLRSKTILVWRAPLFSYATNRCAMLHFLSANKVSVDFHFMDESDNLPYSEVVNFKAVTLIPWDHALMTFYELYSANIPLLMPSAEWMYRLLYQRGQLSVGERLYQAIMPDHTPPFVEFAESESYREKAGPPSPDVGLSSAKAARGVAEDVLTRGLQSQDLDEARQYLKAALELMQDMRYFLAVAENKTHEDSYTSFGVIRRFTTTAKESKLDRPARPRPPTDHTDPWHPFTPFQMSPVDANDYTRMRRGTWWLRRGVRFDAMRYWYQFSDFARFPGIVRFSNLPDLICRSQTLDVHAASEEMRRYNEKSLVHSVTFWTYSVAVLLGKQG
eukprot:TRINITY_DN92543_c0_g1_i1.p1 TRINITY_DN92543_c0_g1~~TRINITY_DN92543_c0_g1_i1.p1  ORF type:complete len:527 (-),score=77.20 TRINITY_DN92543_c0_g1_i1:33-1514(-)